MKRSELRQNPATREWILIAPEHPDQEALKVEIAPGYDSHCPFCPANERMTPDELLRIPSSSQGPDWDVRVVPDKFTRLELEIPAVKEEGFLRRFPGFGHHEIVVEHPRHNLDIPDMPAEHVLKILKAYQLRQRELWHQKNVRCVTIFRNHGAFAGASCGHPHSHILATPVLPEFMHRKHEIAKSFSSSTQRNLYSEIWDSECSSKRLVESDETMSVFVPFAASVPYEMWIMPREPRPSFSLAGAHELQGLAEMLRRTLIRLRNCCGDVAYNFVIYSCPVGNEGPYYQWHLQITPRLQRPAGAELGPHIRINPMLPEECAERLRKTSIETGRATLLAKTS